MRLHLAFLLLVAVACQEAPRESDTSFAPDTPFVQEYHEAYPLGPTIADPRVRSLAVDSADNVWIATGSGVYVKEAAQRAWRPVLNDSSAGPAYAVLTHGNAVWISTWNRIYRFVDGELAQVTGAVAPVSVLAATTEGVYAIGPKGIWICREHCVPVPADIARSVRSAAAAKKGGVWVASDVGLYHVADTVRHFLTPTYLQSAYVRDVAYDSEGRLWVAGLGGVSVLSANKRVRQLTPKQGLPSSWATTVARSSNDVMWVGTDKGVVRYAGDGAGSLLFSRRWLVDDHVNDIVFDAQGDAWIGTNAGVSAIRRKTITLASKERYFYDVLMRRHIRAPWIAGQCRLPVAGDTTVWEPEDDDNDGQYTGIYLAMESFRYAATGDPVARENARKAFRTLRFLQQVTGTDGFFARTIVPADWTSVHDPNRTYTDRQIADALVEEPRFKPVEVRWHPSADRRWLWKGDTSSDELCGHMFGYFFYYTLVADEQEKQEVRLHVSRIVDHLMANDFTLTDTDGSHTRWGMWSPDRLNGDPEWMPDRNLNSMELLGFMKFAAHITGEQKYERTYRRLITEEGYLDNMKNLLHQNPAWFIYYDVMLAGYVYPLLLKCESDPELLAFYENHMDQWFARLKKDNNPLVNFLYDYARDKKEGLDASVAFLRATPLDLVDWRIDHTRREDVKVVRAPVLEDLQIDKLPPPQIRGTVRWDKNPYWAVTGDPHREREPVFWLLPYWMGRYLGMIGEAENPG